MFGKIIIQQLQQFKKLSHLHTSQMSWLLFLPFCFSPLICIIDSTSLQSQNQQCQPLLESADGSFCGRQRLHPGSTVLLCWYATWGIFVLCIPPRSKLYFLRINGLTKVVTKVVTKFHYVLLFSSPSSSPHSSGVVEVFGSWSKVAPRLDVGNFEVEKQLEEAMREHESTTSTVVAAGNTAKTGFHPLDGSQ